MRRQAMVLVVEDDADIREFTQLTLEAMGGFAVTCCGSAEEALTVVHDVCPDLVLLDVVLPGMDGGAALRALKGDPRTASIPVVLFTARVEEKQRELGEQLGAADVIPKTCSPDELCQRLRQACEQHS